MADEDAPERSSSSSTGQKKPSGNMLTRKVGPLPVWGWGLIAVGVFVVVRKMGAGSSRTSGSTAIGPTSAVTSGTGLPAGYTGGADNVGLDALVQQLQAQLAAQQSTSPAYSSLTGEKLSGGGYTAPGGLNSTPIVTPQGTYSWIPPGGLLDSIVKAGGQIFVQTSPGNFSPVDAGTVLTPGTPLFQQLTWAPASQQAPINGQMPTNSLSGSGGGSIPANKGSGALSAGGLYGALNGAPNPTAAGGTSRVIR